MYAISAGYPAAKERAIKLREAGFQKESFVYSAISLETVCYRLLRSAAVISNMDRELFEEVVSFGGFQELRKKWKHFSKGRLSLSDWFKNSGKKDLWKKIDRVLEARNNIFHGKAGISTEEVLELSDACWEAIDFLMEKAKEEGWDDPFSRARRFPRKSQK